MIDYRRSFLVINGIIYYIDLLLEFTVQKGLMDETFGPLGILQPGMVAFTTQDIIPFNTDMKLDTSINFKSPVLLYTINHIAVFKEPKVKFMLSGNSEYEYFYLIKSQCVDILQERFRKYTSEHRIKTIIKTLYVK